MSDALPMPMQRTFALLISVALALSALVPLAAPSPTRAASTELFFSEYIEGSSNNKALEIYNGTGAPVDLAAGGYTVQVFFNGSASAGLTINLAGGIAAGDVFVLAQSSASAAILAEADQTNGSGWFNGDDAVVLRRDGSVIDVIGQIGFDPGSQWGTGLVSTADNTLRRNATVEAGDPDGSDAFDPSVEWDGFATDTFDGLGTHTISPPPPAAAVLNEFSANTTGTDIEYVEVLGEPSTELSTLTILEIEGDSGAATGTVDEVIPVGTTNASGLWHVDLPANALENGTITLLLVNGFTGDSGADLDADNDGAFDATPWDALLDAVAVNDGGAGDLTYGLPVLGVAYDGMAFAPGGASRIPDGADTDSATDWVRNDFDLAGISGAGGTPVEGEAYNTPGAPNALVEPPSSVPNLVINEIDYDQASTDTAEFVEIKNVGESAASLDGVTLELVNGNGGGIYSTVALPSVSLAAGDYFVVCANGTTTADCDLDASPDTNFIQNGAPDAVALRIGGALIDTVSYEGDTAGGYTEGSGTGLFDTDAEGTSIGRCPDGSDTDQNNADFVLSGITPGAANDCGEPPPPLSCDDPVTLIHAIQGSGAASQLIGQTVTIQGVVTGFLRGDELEEIGYFVQEEAGQADGDPLTSEGIMVHDPANLADVSDIVDETAGAVIAVRGVVEEYFGKTRLTSVSGVADCDLTGTVSTVDVSLPAEDDGAFEPYEGMLVRFPQVLTISEFFNFARHGEIVLTVDRDHQPTAVYEPGSPEAEALAEENRRNRITLDDATTTQNPDPARHPNGEEFTLDHRFRGGDTLANVTGVMDYSFGIYRVQPTAGADYTPVNVRPEAPEDVGGSLTVASFNVLNYFTTLDLGPDICGPAEDQECRGADSAEELERQQAKIVAALAAMDADVVGLIEIENHPADDPTATLVQALNAEMGAGTYEYVATGAIGTDAIRVALIYKPAAVSPVGDFAILDSAVDPRFDDERSRPVLAQSFTEHATGGVVTVAVNHLKSKGSDCGGAPDDDPVQGNCNLTRALAAEALVDWLATDPTGSGDLDALIIGDLNAYDREDPIDEVREGADDAAATNDDFTDLVREYEGEFAYSYVFDRQLGYLDHALANGTLVSQVTGATVWQINADEPSLIDYDTSFKKDAQDAIYAPDPYRSSDHDPVIVGLDLAAFGFGGLEPPVDEENEARAGSTVAVKFSLDEQQDVDDVLFESMQVFDCGAWPHGASVDAAATGSTVLRYDPVDDQYVFTWKTDPAWAGDCKSLVVTLGDGTYVIADFEFRP